MNRDANGFDVDEVKDLMERRFQMWVWVFVSFFSFGLAEFFLIEWAKEGAARDLLCFIVLMAILAVSSIAVWGKRR